MGGVAERLLEVRGRMAEACRAAGRAPESVRLVAVSKRQPDALLGEAVQAGQLDFGENYVQELLRKQALAPSARFHLIGHVQTNKAKRAARAALVHTVDSERLALALARGVAEGEREGPGPLPVLVEVNLASEPQKAGVEPEGVEPLLVALAGLPELDPLGLMCIPPAGEGRPWFSRLRSLAERQRDRTGLLLPELSMGMSADYEEAILEGATLVRIGTAVFGPRDV